MLDFYAERGIINSVSGDYLPGLKIKHKIVKIRKRRFTMENKMIIFDADGTLLGNQTNGLMGGFKDVLVALGKRAEVLAIDKEYQKRKHLGPWGLEQLAELCKGFSKSELDGVALKYVRETLRPEAEECLRALKIRGSVVGAISSNPQFVMDVLADILALDFSEGNELEFRNGKSTGKIKRKVDRYVKADILEKKMKKYAIERKDVVVVGDSITDLPMAELAGIFIAFRPREDAVREKADSVIKDLNALLRKGLL